jgi:hypothetical protein
MSSAFVLPRPVTTRADNTVTQFTGDPATIPFASHRHIAIVIGTPVARCRSSPDCEPVSFDVRLAARPLQRRAVTAWECGCG